MCSTEVRNRRLSIICVTLLDSVTLVVPRSTQMTNGIAIASVAVELTRTPSVRDGFGGFSGWSGSWDKPSHSNLPGVGIWLKRFLAN